LYVSRDTHPEKWYPTVKGKVQKFDDLPAAYHRNVNVDEVPYNRKRGDKPALSEQEIDDVLAFLRTLDDGYSAPRNTK
jgi:cytochrome c peroxidase